MERGVSSEEGEKNREKREGEGTLRLRVMKFVEKKRIYCKLFSLQLGSRLIVICHLISSSYPFFTIPSLSFSLKFKPIEFEFSSLERSLAREEIHFFVIESNVGWSGVSLFLLS